MIYFWTMAKPDFLGQLRHYARVPGIACVGVNVDADSDKAREFARKHPLPGKHHYDGESGPLASRLKIGTTPAIYLVDGNGILRDTQGHVGTLEKLRRMASAESGDTVEGKSQ